jgi:hypothetical protein
MPWLALLFPRSLAEAAYPQAAGQSSLAGEIRELQRHAGAHSISLFSVFCEINRYAKAHGLPALRTKDTDIHAVRNSQRGKLVSEILFAPTPPEPAAYVAAAQNVFRSAFFPALQRMVESKGTGAGPTTTDRRSMISSDQDNYDQKTNSKLPNTFGGRVVDDDRFSAFRGDSCQSEPPPRRGARQHRCSCPSPSSASALPPTSATPNKSSRCSIPSSRSRASR